MKIALPLTVLALAPLAHVVTAEVGNPSHVAPAAAETYEIDGGHSGALFRLIHAGVAPFWGRFNQISGSYAYDPDSPEACTIRVEIAADSVDTNSESRDNHVKSPDFFSVKEFPVITFASTKVTAAEGGALRVVGDLSLHGVTREVTAIAEFTGRVESARGTKSGFEARFKVKRSEFGMDSYLEGVSDEVQLIVFVEGKLQ